MMYASVWSNKLTHDTKETLREIRDWASPVATWLVIGLGAVLWITGGIHPQSQTQYEELTRQVAELQRTLGAINDKINLMPRPSDYAAQNDHLARIDNEITALGDRITSDEIRASAADARTQRLIDGADARVGGHR